MVDTHTYNQFTSEEKKEYDNIEASDHWRDWFMNSFYTTHDNLEEMYQVKEISPNQWAIVSKFGHISPCRSSFKEVMYALRSDLIQNYGR